MILQKYTILAVVSSAVLTSGCSGNSQQHSQPATMWETFQEMSDRLEQEPQFATYKPYLSQILLEDIQSDSELDLDEQIHFLAPSLWFEQMEAHYEGRDQGRNCLTVNGQSVDGDPISAALEYIPVGQELKIRAVEIALYEAGDALPMEAWCPVRPDEF